MDNVEREKPKLAEPISGRKDLALAATLLLGISAISGCARGDSETRNDVQITPHIATPTETIEEVPTVLATATQIVEITSSIPETPNIPTSIEVVEATPPIEEVYQTVVGKAVKHVFDAIGQEVPENIQKLLPACNEEGIPSESDYVRTVVYSSATVGSAVRDKICEIPESELRNRLIGDLEIIREHTNSKIDKFLTDPIHRFSDPGNIESFRAQIMKSFDLSSCQLVPTNPISE